MSFLHKPQSRVWWPVLARGSWAVRPHPAGLHVPHGVGTSSPQGCNVVGHQLGVGGPWGLTQPLQHEGTLQAVTVRRADCFQVPQGHESSPKNDGCGAHCNCSVGKVGIFSNDRAPDQKGVPCSSRSSGIISPWAGAARSHVL